MKNSREIRKCPFCGEPVVMLPAQTDEGVITGFCCSGCQGIIYPPAHTQSNIKEMITWWNHRVTDLGLSKELTDLLNG